MNGTRIATIVVVAIVLLALFLFVSGYGSNLIRN